MAAAVNKRMEEARRLDKHSVRRQHLRHNFNVDILAG